MHFFIHAHTHTHTHTHEHAYIHTACATRMGVARGYLDSFSIDATHLHCIHTHACIHTACATRMGTSRPCQSMSHNATAYTHACIHTCIHTYIQPVPREWEWPGDVETLSIDVTHRHYYIEVSQYHSPLRTNASLYDLEKRLRLQQVCIHVCRCVCVCFIYIKDRTLLHRGVTIPLSVAYQRFFA